MPTWLSTLLDWLSAAPPAVVYLVLGVMSALENVVPPVPADVVVVFGGVLAGQGIAQPAAVFLVVWLSNVAGALLVYAVGWRYGPAFFSGRLGALLLNPGQLRRLGHFYRRYGFGIIFVSRFLPMFRAVVPVFAGTSRVAFWRTALPLSAASGLWYGSLVYLGVAAGRNIEVILGALDSAGRWLWAAAAGVAVVVGWWWWRSR